MPGVQIRVFCLGRWLCLVCPPEQVEVKMIEEEEGAGEAGVAMA